jgi:predicted RNase H-like HicB family nuclease
MKHEFTLEFWQDDGWYVGKLKEIPGVFSQGETLNELEENIADAYRMMSEETLMFEHPPAQTKGIVLEVA